jgi:hypothetical protein
MTKTEKQVYREDFMRIASAQLKSRYPFTPQRIAMAAYMYNLWISKEPMQNNPTPTKKWTTER